MFLFLLGPFNRLIYHLDFCSWRNVSWKWSKIRLTKYFIFLTNMYFILHGIQLQKTLSDLLFIPRLQEREKFIDWSTYLVANSYGFTVKYVE